ncbi:uncharacterized protein DS421_14g471860 [Arachis hypogaea]|nr:uncharacterized protein DS421_14g471860 [Arachis hypogaea]
MISTINQAQYLISKSFLAHLLLNNKRSQITASQESLFKTEPLSTSFQHFQKYQNHAKFKISLKDSIIHF